MFQLKQVACAYEQKKVFTGLDLEIRQGQYVMLMGENGTGKSSLISLLTGFKQEESGRILFLGKDLKEWLKDKRQKRDFYSRLGILFQDVDSQLFNSTVYDEIAFGPRQLGLTEEEVSQRVQDTLSLLKIEDLRDRVPYQLSGGENGTGKSSLISLLTGFKQEESGRILFLGKDLKEWLKDKRQKRDFYSRLGILFQDVDSQLFNSTVYDEIAFGPRQLGLTEEEVSQRVQDTLSLLKIEDLRDRVPYQLSGGEKKKVAFASIMVTNPDVYILDEPFNNLSKEYEEFFRELLHELHSAGKTIIMSAHHFKHLHHEKADVLLFEDGKADFFPAQEVLNNQQVIERLSHY